ncbi:hypothetical protein K1T71_007031 [Dendrolimus kikuchii]|uniref:Uncharacterized protein n=1 Tax=Dendrolimus kikuchii TaxID=765133 RepID=A0ACC1D0W2_9NEOP|nr:hypothetical protein K1T71_007031 [Dendrolimus kikuchii]
MMGMLWVVLFVALTATQSAYGLPVRPTPHTSIYGPNAPVLGWGGESGVYAALPALVLVITAVGLLFGCTWCYRHKDCKLFTASATHLHESRRTQPPDSGFSEPVNNNISEDNNNGPISLREMQNIANNNATAYIVSENEERNRVSRESVVEFEPLPTGIRVADPLENCADWFGGEDFPRNQLQYLREISRGWFGRVVEGELEDTGSTSTVAVKILNQNASLEDKARFLTESRMYRDARHDNILVYVAKCLQEDPWMLVFEFCPMDLQQYLIENRPKMAILNESGVPLRLMCDVTSALAYLHSRGYLYGALWSGSVLVRGQAEDARAVLGQYSNNEPQHEISAPEATRHPSMYMSSSEVWSLGGLVWEVCAWGATLPHHPPPMPDLPCPYRSHLYQVMQLCWNQNPDARPSAAQVHALINHLHSTHTEPTDSKPDTISGTSDFQERWQRLKPNTIPKIDEHIAIIHAPSTSTTHFSSSDQEFDHSQTIQDSLSVDLDTAVSRSSSIMSDKEPLSVQIKSESLTNLHGSLEDVRNIYLTHNEMAILECHQGNISMEDSREKEHDKSDSSVDPWLKDIMAGSQDDVSYYKDVSDVIKNLDNILNSEKTSSSESSHQASPSRDNLSLDCKKDYPMQSSMVKSPGITNFQNILETGFNTREDRHVGEEDDGDRDTVGTLSHSFERHSDTTSQQTLENLTPETPIKDMEIRKMESEVRIVDRVAELKDDELPKVNIVCSNNKIPKLKELCVASMPSVSGIVSVSEDCGSPCDNLERTEKETKSVDRIRNANLPHVNDDLLEQVVLENVEHVVLPKNVSEMETSIKRLDTIPTITSLPSIVENTIHPELHNDLIEITIVKDSVNESCENNLIDDDVLRQGNNKEEIAPKTLENKIISRPVLIKSLEKEISPTEIKNVEEDKDICSKTIVEIYKTLNEGINTQIDTSHETRNVILQNNKIFNILIENEVVESPVQENGSNEIKVVGSSDLPLLKNIVSTGNASPDGCQEDKIKPAFKTEKSKDIIESIAFIEFERSNFIDKPILIQSDNKLMLNCPGEVKGIIISDIKSPACLERIDIVEDEKRRLITLPSENVIEQMSNDTYIPKLPSLQAMSEDIQINSYSIPEKVSAELNNLSGVNSEASTLTNLPIFKCDVVTEKNVNEDIEVPFDDCIQSPRFPDLSNYSNEETVLITDLDNSSVVVQTGITDESEPFGPSNELNQNLTEVETPLDIERNPEIKDFSEKCENKKLSHKTFTKLSGETDDKPLELPTEFTSREIEHTYLNIETDNKMSVSQDTPEIVQNSDKFIKINEAIDGNPLTMSPDIVQSIDKEAANCKGTICKEEQENISENTEEINMQDINDPVLVQLDQQLNDSTIYMDLINNTNSDVLKNSYISDKGRKDPEVSNSNLKLSENSMFSNTVDKLECTEYMDLPNVNKTNTVLDTEKFDSSVNIEDAIAVSTPKTSDTSAANAEETIKKSPTEAETLIMGESKAPDYGAGVTVTKLEQRFVPDSLSPFESPTRSHHTDTYDENSSVVLGPFENCTIELFKGVKSHEFTDIPREELLAFSSNFSEMNLETPSPLRDGNFLNEVPDILHDEVQFDDITSISEAKPLSAHDVDIVGTTGTQSSENSEESQSETQKHISPSTPPNSPGIFLASSSQQKYLVDIDLNVNDSVPEPSSSLQQEIELNQIELQITSKLAMAENENNLNIEYSGPLTVEGLVEEVSSDEVPEAYLAGNGSSVEDFRSGICQLDEECVKALRNELELKLPLAQVAAIEPQSVSEWGGELPPPPELVVSYPGALSPIAEETGQQLSAYDNDTNWNPSTRTDSSESYPEPCNNSTDEATEPPTGAQTHTHSTYTIHSNDHTYTVQKDVGSSKEISMTADSLNASPYKKIKDDPESPINEKNNIKEDHEKESNCERLSQVSPFLVSPTTDTSAPDNSDNFDNATGVSTLSKTTLPTDAKLSKPTECLSKATSIDSWCSNDTLYNVEENFDDMAVDPEPPSEFEHKKCEKEDGNSESTDTLTHNEDEKELSHCSTYIIHDSKSEPCETFSPDSMTANDNNTYTKAKTEAVGVTLSTVKSESRNSPTKDLAYGTLMSEMPSYSNCTTEAASFLDDLWKFPPPELVRRSPIGNEPTMTPPKVTEHKETIITEVDSPLTAEPRIKKMDSIEISFIQNNSEQHSQTESSESQDLNKDIHSPVGNFMHGMTPSITSTPLTELNDFDDVQPIPMQLPETKESPGLIPNIPNFQMFMHSAEIRPQDLSTSTINQFTKSEPSEILLEGDSRTLSRNSNRDSIMVSERTPTYSDFENSAVTKPQEITLVNWSGQSMESGISSEGFKYFENSARNVPQDLSSLIDATSWLLRTERMSSEQAMDGVASSSNVDLVSESRRNMNECGEESTQSLTINPPSTTNLIESQNLVNFKDSNNPYLINFDMDEEMDQPHSIIITETSLEHFKETPHESYESHAGTKYLDLNCTYDSHASRGQLKLNGEINIDDDNFKSPKSNDTEERTENSMPITDTSNEIAQPEVIKDLSMEQNKTSNGSLEDDKPADAIQCNGSSQKYAVVNFLSETFEELLESNVDDGDVKDLKAEDYDEDFSKNKPPQEFEELLETPIENPPKSIKEEIDATEGGVTNGRLVESGKITSVTEDFLQNEKKFCTLDSYFPLLSDIRFTGPATEIMSTSFSQESPTAPTSPECEQDSKPHAVADIMKEWDSDSDTHSTNSSSGEFIWKQRGSGGSTSNSGGGAEMNSMGSDAGGASGASGSGSLASGSEGDEVEFVPSSWDCRAAPAKSSLRSLEQTPPDSKKRVVFKRQKYHCVYEYPREVADIDAHSPAAYLPDRSTYSEWDPSSAEEAELGYGQLFGAPSALDLYPLRAGIALGADYDEDFFISSSARPFESLGIMSTTSQFFPGMHMKQALLERELADDITEDFPPPPSPLITTTTPTLDFTTPDSGVEDITPGSTTDEDFKKKLLESELTWRPVDSGSSSESVSPSSPGGEALGGLRHTRDKLKLDLPPSPHIPSPRHNRVFNFVLDKPKRRTQAEGNSTPLVMTDDTPVVTSTLPLQKDCEDMSIPEPTFSTFGKSVQKVEPEQKIILTDDIEDGEVKEESPKVVEPVKGEGTVLDSGDEDSGIESSSKATLERNKTSNVS